jgi:hypothetical protein
VRLRPSRQDGNPDSTRDARPAGKESGRPGRRLPLSVLLAGVSEVAPQMTAWDELEEPEWKRPTRLPYEANASVSADRTDAPEPRPKRASDAWTRRCSLQRRKHECVATARMTAAVPGCIQAPPAGGGVCTNRLQIAGIAACRWAAQGRFPACIDPILPLHADESGSGPQEGRRYLCTATELRAARPARASGRHATVRPAAPRRGATLRADDRGGGARRAAAE